MTKDNSFDVVSQVNMQEVTNVVDQATRELRARFDFKGSKSDISYDGETITLVGDDEFKLKSLIDILESKMVKREVDLKALRYGKIEPAAKDTLRQRVTFVQGLDKDKTKIITKMVKESKLKVQAAIQGEQVRISGKNRDDLQLIMQKIKDYEFDIPIQFVNYRTY